MRIIWSKGTLASSVPIDRADKFSTSAYHFLHSTYLIIKTPDLQQNVPFENLQIYNTNCTLVMTQKQQDNSIKMIQKGVKNPMLRSECYAERLNLKRADCSFEVQT